jgi:hypothetical protein
MRLRSFPIATSISSGDRNSRGSIGGGSYLFAVIDTFTCLECDGQSLSIQIVAQIVILWQARYDVLSNPIELLSPERAPMIEHVGWIKSVSGFLEAGFNRLTTWIGRRKPKL